MRLSRAALVGVLVLAALATFVVLAWPRADDRELRDAYAQLEGAPIPVKALGWIAPQAARAEVRGDGYTLELRDPDLGDVTIGGCRGCSVGSLAGDVRWSEGDVSYAVRTTAEPALVLSRVVPLAVAREQITGRSTDAPLLYLVYLPAFVVFAGWGVWSLLMRPVVR